MNREDNETKVLVAQIQADNKLQAAQLTAQDDGITPPMSETDKRKLEEQIREFDLKLRQDDRKLDLEKERNQIARIQKNAKH